MISRETEYRMVLATGILSAFGLLGLNVTNDNQVNGQSELDCNSNPNGSITNTYEVDKDRPLELGGAKLAIDGDIILPSFTITQNQSQGWFHLQELVPVLGDQYRISDYHFKSGFFGQEITFINKGVIYDADISRKDNETVVVDLTLSCEPPVV